MKMVHVSMKRGGQYRIRNIPLLISLIPPSVAILLTLLFKEVVVSLFVGIWVGAFINEGLRIESPFYFFISFFDVLQTYIIDALLSRWHITVIVFSHLLI